MSDIEATPTTWIPLSDAARQTGARYMRLWRAVSRGQIKSKRKDGIVYLDAASLSAYIAKGNARAESHKLQEL